MKPNRAFRYALWVAEHPRSTALLYTGIIAFLIVFWGAVGFFLVQFVKWAWNV